MSKKKGDTKSAPSVQQLMNEEAEGSLEGFIWDPAVCRRAFDHYDKDKSGYLDTKELMKLADKLWDTFFPQGPKLADANKRELVLEIMNKTDMDKNKEVTYDEIEPWFRKMNEKFYKITHPKTEEQKDREKERERSGNRGDRERAAPPAPPPEVSSVADSSFAGAGAGAGTGAGAGAGAGTTTSPPPPPPPTESYGGSPGKYVSTTGYSSYIRPSASGAASELTLDLEALKAKIADLRSSVQGFAAALDTRLDMCLQSVKMHSLEAGAETSNSGVV